MSWPNLITFLRMFLVPILIIAFFQKYICLATIVFLIAAITDAIDGFLARRIKQTTTLGACLDPIADKILLSSSFVLLAWYKYLPSWLAVVVISRDIFILLGGLLLFLFNIPFEVRPSILGKFTTFIQIITILAVLIHIQKLLPLPPLSFFYFLTLIFTISSGLQYAYIGYKKIS
ncbi:MAG: CDP-diacylglycerol--glycerol-3-phosphate 3-phosphatidyltransferase [Candidatus Desulfofervidus auxilii]|nr:CDP-diacylglycerol--glycerol-3-phosphate 3-phosphatidyltransferase [Candidatus Desulfofervidus auxilii]